MCPQTPSELASSRPLFVEKVPTMLYPEAIFRCPLAPVNTSIPGVAPPVIVTPWRPVNADWSTSIVTVTAVLMVTESPSTGTVPPQVAVADHNPVTLAVLAVAWQRSGRKRRQIIIEISDKIFLIRILLDFHRFE